MSGSLLPNAKQQYFDSNGAPLAGGKVYYYIPSTTTLKNTYQDFALTVLNTNPIVLDSAGECIAYGLGAYRQQVYDVNNNLIWDQVTYGIDASTINYTAPYANSVSTTVQAKLAQTVSVIDFGADSSGVNDSTNAIQNAANALTNGGRLYIPKGTYSVSSIIYLKDKTTIFGDGIGTTLIQSTSSNTTGVFQSWDSSQGNIYTGNVTRTYFGVFDLSIDMGHTLDRTSTTVSGGVFVQWNYSAGCIIAGNTRDVVIENVKLSNAGYGISTGSNTNVFIRNVDISGMQWDGIQTQFTQDVMTITNARIYSTGRNGIISFKDRGQITVENFTIIDCYTEGVEIEQQYDNTSTKHPVVQNGFMYLCGTFVQIESYGVTGWGTIENVYMTTPLVATVAGSGFGSKTIGYADQYYNLSSGAGWTGTPSFPVPNVPGTWGNIANSGVKGEIPTTVRNCVFSNMSTAAITNVTGPVYAYAFYEGTDSSNISFQNCRFYSSNVTAINGEQRLFNNNYFINSLLTINQISTSFTNNPSTIVSDNLFTGTGAGISVQDNAVITSNIFRNISGVAISITGVPSDGRTTISNNEIVDSRGGSALMTYGVYCSFQNPPNCFIENNYIYGATTTGVYLYDSTSSTGYVVTNNRIEGCTFGITVDRGNNDVIQGNVMRNNTSGDIRLYGATAGVAASTGVRLVNNLLQSTVSVTADSYTTLPGTTRFCNNEYTTLSPANIFSWGGSNVVQGNWN